MIHECIIEKKLDVFAYVEQYLVRCRCHMDRYIVWRPNEPPFECLGGE